MGADEWPRACLPACQPLSSPLLSSPLRSAQPCQINSLGSHCPSHASHHYQITSTAKTNRHTTGCVSRGPGRDMAALESADSFINELIKWVSLTSASCHQGLPALPHLTHVYNKASCFFSFFSRLPSSTCARLCVLFLSVVNSTYFNTP